MENKTKIILVVLVLLVVCGVGIQMFMSPDAVNSSGNQTVTDMANRTVSIPNDVRARTFAPLFLEILAAEVIVLVSPEPEIARMQSPS